QQLIAFLNRAYGYLDLAFVGLVVAGPMLFDWNGLVQCAVAQYFVPLSPSSHATAYVYVHGAALVGF
ncbi:hypothetical protein VW35_16480, partial [Devosia soli]